MNTPVCCTLLLLAASNMAGPAQTSEPYAWRTLTGHPGGAGNADGPGAAARFWYPSGVAADSAGNIYVADTFNHAIRKITANGSVTTFAGSPGETGAADGAGNTARFASPASVAVDAEGNLYVADTDNSTIRKVTSAGIVSTLAGLAGQPGTADGTGTVARFSYPLGAAVDGAGNVYVADSGNSTIRKVTSSGGVTTLAGTAGHSGSADGPVAAAQFYFPSGVAVDNSGNIYVADQDNQTIRKLNTNGQVMTLAGSVGEPGSADGTNTTAQFYYPSSLTVDTAGNIYVADSFNSTIRKITSTGTVTTLAGNPADTGSDDGLGSQARFYYPAGIALGTGGNLYVADSYNSAIRRVTMDAAVTTLAGRAGQPGSSDAKGSQARFNGPYGIAADGAGRLYVADTGNHTVRTVTQGGLTATLAGAATQPGTNDGIGSAARFNAPYSIVADNSGNLYIADTSNNTIRRLSSSGQVTTLAGSASQAGSTDGTGSAARFSAPVGIATDGAGSLYVADFYSNIIRKVTSDGVVTTLAGSSGQPGSTDGAGSAARFRGPFGVVTDNSGSLFVTDSGNHTVRKITSAGVVSTLAGNPGAWGSADGTGSAASFFSPTGLARDSAGNLFVADTGNSTVRRVTLAGLVTTLAGSAGQPGTSDGIRSAARFFYPIGLTADSSGSLYLTDVEMDTIRKITSGGVVTTLAGSPQQAGSVDVSADMAEFYVPSGVALDTAGNLFVADTYNDTIRKVTSDGAVRTIAGAPGEPGSMDGIANSRLSGPLGLAVDVAGIIYFADSLNHTIRKISTNGAVITLAGSAGQPGSADGTGQAARFSHPACVAVDPAGNIFVTDGYNSTIRKLASDGTVTTWAGSPGQFGSADGPRGHARFDGPNGVAADSVGNLYVADSGNSILRKISSDGVVITVAGSAGQPGSADGTGSAARFDYPFGVAVDHVGNVYVADSGNSTIRKVTSGGAVTTIGGLAGVIGGTDGSGSSATFAGPAGIAVDPYGRLYVADTGNNRISQGLPLPTLRIFGSTASVNVIWPSPSAGFSLQQSSNPADSTAWTTATYTITDDGTNRTVTITPPAANQFFRLIAN